jgi:hypothetical protein
MTDPTDPYIVEIARAIAEQTKRDFAKVLGHLGDPERDWWPDKTTFEDAGDD